MPTPGLRRAITDFRRDRRGNVVITAALAAPVLLGSLGLGAEVASWYSGKREMQSAADSAAIAAATRADPFTFDDEARAVAAQYGFADGQNGVSVTAEDDVPCPGGGPANCYRVTVSRARPLLLAQMVGFRGDAEVSGQPAKMISATAIAKQANGPREYCVVALAGSGDPEAIRSNGGPKADLTGCSVMSNSSARCNGHDLNADHGDAVGTNNGCGKKQNSGMEPVKDPYAHLATKVPSYPCIKFPTMPKKKKDESLSRDNQLVSGYQTWGSEPIHKCGDVQLLGETIIDTGPDGAVLVIHDGSLYLDGYTLRTTEGSGLTIIFTGSDGGRPHGIIGDGTLDIAAPKRGTWSGVAIYQDPKLPYGTAVNTSYSGNSPTWKITGLVYMPKASLTFSGAVNKSANGASCFVLVADNILINGTGSILAGGQCAAAGLRMPSSKAAGRGQLVS